MSRLDELLSEEFARWEQRGRGWKVWPEPVQPEPPFTEFNGYQVPNAQLEADDSRCPGFFASLFDSLEKKINPPPTAQETDEPEPNTSDEPLTAEFAAALPAKLDVSGDVFSAFLDAFQDRHDPTAFELLATHENITVQFAASPADAPTLERQLAAYFPKVPFIPSEHALATAWNGNEGTGFIVDFGLAHECMLSLQTQHALDPFINLMSVLNTVQPEEVALFQVLFQPVQHPWPASVWRSVTDANGKALFVNRLDLIPGTKEKLEAPLFGAVVRVAVKAADFERAADLVRDMASALRAYSRRERNHFIPLHNDDYGFEEHETDLLNRQSRRGGLLLNRDELRALVHLPSDAVNVPKLRRQRANSKAAPANVRSPAGVLLGRNVHAGQTTPVHLSAEQRTRHVHIIGASGSGKSTLLFNLIQQDIESGDGLAVLDPHGDLIDRILGTIPADRLDDVVLVDPSDEGFSVGFNILHAHSPLERTLLASDLVSVFRRLSTSWGDQMDAVLRNAILAFLHSSRPGTLADLRRFLIEKDYRAAFLQTVDDPEIVYYWQRGFPLLAGTKSVGPIITRLNDFLATPTIRCMVSQPESKLDFAGIMDTGKIFLAKLPSGLAGEKDCHLLGSLLVSKFQQVAMSRQAQAASARRDFWIYADEFDHFITPSMAEILKGTRKYRVGLTLAHHELHQLQREPDVASAVMSNASTRIVFRVGDEDARKLADGFASFEARDLQNLGTGEAVVRVERSDADFNLVIPLPELPNPTVASEVRNRAITVSRSKYAVPRAEVEARLRQQREAVAPEPPPEPRPAKARKQASPQPAPEPAPAVVEPKIETPAPAVVEPALVVTPPTLVETSPPVAEKAASLPPPEIKTVPVAETKPATQPETSPTVRESSEPRDLGRGGEQHKNIQQRIQAAADKLGLQTAIESQLDPASNQAADVTLKCGAMTMAVEITISTTTDHEFGNIRKCLTAGFHRVALVSPKPAKLRDIEQAVKAGLDASEAAKVGYFTPEAFLEELKKLSAELKQSTAPELPKERVVHGYKIRRSGPALSAEERQAKERIALRTLSAVLSEAEVRTSRGGQSKS